MAETQPELLARHFAEAGLGPQAIAYLQKAGERAAERSAYAEAISHLTRGLELLQALPDGPERTLQELDLRIALGAALMATRGYAGPEVEETYLRARELCRPSGRDAPALPGAARPVPLPPRPGGAAGGPRGRRAAPPLGRGPGRSGAVRGGPSGARGAAVLAGGGDRRAAPAGAGGSSLRGGSAPVARLGLRDRPRRGLPVLRGPGPVAARPTPAGPGPEPRGAQPGPGPVPPAEPGPRPGLGGLAAAVPPRAAAGAGARRGRGRRSAPSKGSRSGCPWP